MILSYLESGLPLFSASAGAVIAWIVAQRRGEAALAGTTKLLVTTRLAQESAARRAQEAEDEVRRWRGMSLAGASLSPPREPIYAARPAPVDATELVRLTQGLALVDDVMIADAGGLPMVAELDGSATTLAAIAAPASSMIRALESADLPVVQIRFASFSAEHLAVRILPGRAEGLLLVVRTTSQPVNPLALDAVVHAASRVGEDGLPVLPPAELRGTTETLLLDSPRFSELHTDLGRELRNEVRGLVLTLDERPVFSAAVNGPAEGLRTLVVGELARLQRRVNQLLRSDSPMARVELMLRDGTQIAWAALAPHSRLALVTFGRTDERVVERLAGLLRRVVDPTVQGRAA